MTVARVLATLGMITLAGCYAARLEPLRPFSMTLHSATPVRLVTVGAEGVAASPCLTLNAVAYVQQLRGDTLFYAKIVSQRPSPREAPCNRDVPGYIDLAAHPSLTTLSVTPSAPRSTFAVIATPFLAVGGVILLLIFLSQ
jgi:hypothetical protein